MVVPNLCLGFFQRPATARIVRRAIGLTKRKRALAPVRDDEVVAVLHDAEGMLHGDQHDLLGFLLGTKKWPRAETKIQEGRKTSPCGYTSRFERAIS